MKKLFLICLIFLASCQAELQLTHIAVKLQKKAIAYRGNGERVVQYWRDERGLFYYELLPEGDTGQQIGTISYAFINR